MSSAPSDILDTPAAKGGADDLLSQMAGDEINRLLSDAELEPANPPAAPAPADREKAALDAAMEPSPSLPPGDTVSKELDQVFAQQTGQPAVAASGTPTAPTPSTTSAPSVDALPADGVAELLGSLTADSGTTAAEATHEAAVAAPAVAATPTVVELKTPEGLVESRWSRILDVVSLPLDPFPDSVRDMIGKIAIVTAINAIAVWAYIMIFK